MSTDQQLSEPEQASRTRRAEPITQHIAKNGAVSYWFPADMGAKPDGSRDHSPTARRRRRREFRRITSEVAAGIYTRRTAITVDDACDQWLDGRRGIRRVTLEGYRNDLKPVRRYLGGKRLQQIVKADGDALVQLMLTKGRGSPKHYQPGSLSSRVAERIGQHPEGISARRWPPRSLVRTCTPPIRPGARRTR